MGIYTFSWFVQNEMESLELGCKVLLTCGAEIANSGEYVGW